MSAPPIEDSDEDLPEDFFDEFTKNDGINNLLANLVDDGSPVARRSRSKSSSYDTLQGKHTDVLEEIKRLERDIAERRKKLCRSPAHSRSPVGRTHSPIEFDLGRRSSRRRSRSRSKEKRRRTRSRSRTRKRSRSRRRSRSRHRRRSIESKPSKEKNLSFLEELAEKFAREGKPFPEGTNLARSHLNAMQQPSHSIYAPGPVPPPMGMQSQMMYSMGGGPGPAPQMAGVYNPFANRFTGSAPIDYPGIIPSYPILQNDPRAMQHMMGPMSPLGRQHHEDDMPRKSIMDDVIEIKRESQTEEMIEKCEREKTFTRCREAVEALRSLTKDPLPRRFLYTSTTIPKDPQTIENNKYKSPLLQEQNVQFELTSFDPVHESQKHNVLEPFLTEIVTILGADINILLKPKFIPPARERRIINDESQPHGTATQIIQHDANDALPPAWYENVGVQTDELFCDKCVTESLKVYKQVGMQTTEVRLFDVGVQTTEEDSVSLSEMTPAQIRALNDFGKILRNGLTPTTYREATELRDRLYNVYQSCTSMSAQFYPQRNDSSQNDRPQQQQQQMHQNEMPRNVSRNSMRDEYSRRSPPQSTTNNGMMTSKQIMDMETSNRSGRGVSVGSGHASIGSGGGGGGQNNMNMGNAGNRAGNFGFNDQTSNNWNNDPRLKNTSGGGGPGGGGGGGPGGNFNRFDGGNNNFNPNFNNNMNNNRNMGSGPGGNNMGGGMGRGGPGDNMGMDNRGGGNIDPRMDNRGSGPNDPRGGPGNMDPRGGGPGPMDPRGVPGPMDPRNQGGNFNMGGGGNQSFGRSNQGQFNRGNY